MWSTGCQLGSSLLIDIIYLMAMVKVALSINEAIMTPTRLIWLTPAMFIYTVWKLLRNVGPIRKGDGITTTTLHFSLW